MTLLLSLLQVLTSLVAAAAAASLQGYSLPSPRDQSFTHGGSGIFGGGGFTSGGPGFSVGGGGFTTGGVGGVGCGDGQVRHVDGSCVTPQVTRNLYVYRAPDVAPIIGPRPPVAPPRLEHNIVFIHTPNGLFSQEPLVVPPPQQKNVVYVLNKRPQVDPTLLEVPAGEQEPPEIYFVNYAEGENPQLPLGGDLQSALSKAEESSGAIIGDTGVSGTLTTGGQIPTGVPAPSGLYTSP